MALVVVEVVALVAVEAEVLAAALDVVEVVALAVV